LGDESRKPGYSKDGKHGLPQVVLGLLVSQGGYPLAYCVHEGNKYEGHTMLPVVEDFVKRFDLKDFVAVADSGLMNSDNIELLEANHYKYILGARIKNGSRIIKTWILSQEKADGIFYEYQKTKESRLIVGYSEKRAGKDAHNRDKGIKRLEKEYKSGSITKDRINKRGYNKFTKKRIEAHVCICFVAYKVYREPERILKTNRINLSVDKALDIAKTITTLKIKLPFSGETLTKTMLLTPKHKSIANLFDSNFWKNV
jgi:transposase